MALVNSETASLPWLYIKGRLCERFHCLPSQLAEEDAQELFWITQLLITGDQILEAHRPKS